MMDKYSKAYKYLESKGFGVQRVGNSLFVLMHNENSKERVYTEVTEKNVDYYAEQYDEETEVRKIKEADPYETLEEIARIFHYRGWDIGHGSAVDTDFINSSDEFLGLVYQAFNPFNKK
ncbi:MAG: hypothetical protein VXB01_03490 [Opitutae bacterium]